MGVNDPDWRDKDLLYELYHGEGLDKRSIGERLGCSDTTVANWMERLGVPDARAWERAGYVESLYCERQMTQTQIADILTCNQTSVSRTLREAGVETRDAGDYHEPSFYFSETGYLTCRHRDGQERVAFRIHRLAAVAEYGWEGVVGKEVHHKNRHRADNRAENLEPISAGEHAAHHHEHGEILENYPS